MNRYKPAKVLVLGLGGGYLNTYLHHNYPKMDITVIELEPQMLEISRKWFGLTLDERQRVIIKDGVHFVENAVAEGHNYDAILVDACVSDISQWLICPCETFVKPKMVENFAKLLSERGWKIGNETELPDLVALELVTSVYCAQFGFAYIDSVQWRLVDRDKNGAGPLPRAFIVNVLSMRYEHHSVGRELRNRFRAAFKNCILLHSHSQTNTV
ncbi:hypothetical protein ANCDUO_24262 [Ancylostoma duodenale]|uniref:PABS domain-containing protein n=1 Tax=Ancylostoma duodenale TaxID=51022 RepID=A0A0C2FG67_9BILA|nr:hypothetical protein ANCDUO_24262 [Ancylostoma duodenale]